MCKFIPIPSETPDGVKSETPRYTALTYAQSHSRFTLGPVQLKYRFKAFQSNREKTLFRKEIWRWRDFTVGNEIGDPIRSGNFLWIVQRKILKDVATAGRESNFFLR